MDQIHATLLLVDDDAMNRDMLSRRLARKGYTVLTAESGPRALEMLGSSRIDAVLLDVMMPGMSGIETLKRVRQSHSVSELPVIMVTAKDRSEDVVDALDLGANDYVTKPLDFPIVLARIRTQVNARRADPLTGLPNRVLFMDRLERLVNRARTPGGSSFAVFFLDIDRFKLINDSLGHLAGDELLIGLARRLETSLRASDTVARIEGEPTLARLGGDEFTILLDGVRTAADAQAVADRLLAVVAQPFKLQGRDIFTLRQHRHRDERAALRARRGHGARRGHRDVSREGAGQGALRDLRHVDAGGGRAAAAAGIGPAARARAQRAARLLSADRDAVGRAVVRVRGAAALASSDAGRDFAGRVHSGRGRDRPDRPDRQLGAPRVVPSDAGVGPRVPRVRST